MSETSCCYRGAYYSKFDLTLLPRLPCPEDWRRRFRDPLGRGVCQCEAGVACGCCCALRSMMMKHVSDVPAMREQVHVMLLGNSNNHCRNLRGPTATGGRISGLGLGHALITAQLPHGAVI